MELVEAVNSVAAANDFSGVVRIDEGDGVVLASAYGLAHRGHEIPNTVETRFGIASGTKGLTAVAVASLIEDGLLELSTSARSILGSDLPLIRDEVTVEHLLSHRSGIGDYLDEEVEHDLAEYLMPVPVHELASTADYLGVLDGHETKFPAGERFAYCNSGYVVLALLAERASGVPFHELVHQRVCRPGGMKGSEFLRSDELPGGVAHGYLLIDGTWRTNVFHLPVRGNGDGGIYSTAQDFRAFWSSLFAGRIVSINSVAELVRSRSAVPGTSKRYGLGFWLDASSDAVILEGCDAGVSFRSVHHPGRKITHTVISNTTDGAWPIARLLNERLST